MRAYSTPQSALDQEITKLAIAECIASVGIYISIGLYFGTFKYLALAVVLAPLTLFRTERSVEWALSRYKQSLEAIGRMPEPFDVVTPYFVGPVIGSVIRIVSTIYWAVRTPLQTLKDTPQNWLRQSLCTDFAYPPEIVPQEALSKDKVIFKFSDFLEVIRDDPNIVLWITVAGYILPFFIIGWVSSVLYRISFKATAIVYMPLIWVVHATLKNPLTVKARLKRIKEGEIEKVRRGISWIVFVTLTAKLALAFTWINKSYLESMFPSQQLITNFVVLDSWPWWQITLGLDAAATFFLLYFADAALARIEDKRAWKENLVQNTVSTISFMRAALSVTTIAGLFYLALGIAAPDLASRFIR